MIDSEILPSNLKNIKFNWMNFCQNDLIKNYVKMVNSIPSYYHVEILLSDNIFGVDGPKWPIHVVAYDKYKWSSYTYEMQNKYTHSIYGLVTILINTKTYQSYSSVKSALK